LTVGAILDASDVVGEYAMCDSEDREEWDEKETVEAGGDCGSGGRADKSTLAIVCALSPEGNDWNPADDA